MKEFTDKHAEVFVNKLYEIIARKNSVELIVKRLGKTQKIG